MLLNCFENVIYLLSLLLFFNTDYIQYLSLQLSALNINQQFSVNIITYIKIGVFLEQLYKLKVWG